MRAYFSRRYRFCASHRLHSEALSDSENRETYGKCNNPHGHGHNYVVEVTVGGPIAPETGMVCDMVELDACVNRQIVQRFDHMNLNLDPLFRYLVPTTENLCMEAYRLIDENFRQAELVRVRIEETGNNAFEYSVRR